MFIKYSNARKADAHELFSANGLKRDRKAYIYVGHTPKINCIKVLNSTPNWLDS